MDERQMVRISKYLSKHLRHQPQRIGLELQPGGWVAVDDLLHACAAHGFPISRSQLDDVVRRNDKQRFAFDSAGMLIRAVQGHSVAIDLELEPVAPPDVLYHGTGHAAVGAIQREGLHRMRRQHVHLSTDITTARRVGARHGRPMVFSVAAAALHTAGWTFYRATNGVWLVEAVPPQYLTLLDHGVE